MPSERVLIVSLHYRPEPNFITADLAEYLSRKGHQVTVLTAHPSYPLGHFYDSVKSLLPRKTLENGVSVWRLPVIPDHSKSKYRRAGYYLSFALMAFFWSFFVPLRQHHVVVYQTPFTTALSAIWRKLIGSRVTYITCDLWPESFPASGIHVPSLVYASMLAYSRWINTFADRIITSTDGIRSRYISDGIPLDKVHFLPVWVDGLPDDPEFSNASSSSGIDIVYAGNLGPAQGLDILIQAASLLKDQPNIQFHIYGSGSEEQNLKNLRDRLGITSVFFYGRVDPETAFKNLQRANFVFLHLKKSPLFHMTLPSKLSSLLACGRLILSGAEGETSRMIASHNAGLIFEAENAASLADTIIKAIHCSEEERTQMIRNAGNLYSLLFAKKILLQKYYSSIVPHVDILVTNRQSAITDNS